MIHHEMIHHEMIHHEMIHHEMIHHEIMMNHFNKNDDFKISNLNRLRYFNFHFLNKKSALKFELNYLSATP